ncbi:MAG: hypothetical protein WC615_20645 [Mucilaginibacter sp.]|jgi:hypothetical protein
MLSDSEVSIGYMQVGVVYNYFLNYNFAVACGPGFMLILHRP